MRKLYRTCLTITAAAVAVSASAAPTADPLAAVFRSLHLGPNARIAAVANPGSCEAAELAAMLHARRVIALERDDLAGSVSGTPCPGPASIQRVSWLTSVSGEASIPIGKLDLVWMAGGYHQLYASLPPARMTALVRALAIALAPGGSLVIADRLAPREVDPMTAARTGSMDPQVVMEQAEAAGLRMQSFANDAGTEADGHTAKAATRFVMVFRRSTRIISHLGVRRDDQRQQSRRH